MNTGEGGLSPYHLQGGAELVFQIGTAKYGVRNEKGNLSDDKLREISAIPQIRMFELKLSQGAKPGKGGHNDHLLRGVRSLGQSLCLRCVANDFQPIPQPLHHGPSNKDRPLKRIGHLPVELIGDRCQQAVLRWSHLRSRETGLPVLGGKYDR